jgi:hypothetical protein
VHRGTPWQTVFLKSTNLISASAGRLADWETWTGNVATNGVSQNSGTPNSWQLDALYSAPVNDQALFDLFTTTLNDNAARGRLSINQTNLAAWSAVLGGVLSLTNADTDSDLQGRARSSPPLPAPVNVAAIQPAGVYNPANPPPLVQLVNGISYVRNLTNTLGGFNGYFSKLGNILSVPQLSDQSPFLNLDSAQRTYGITDEMYERIPQQVMGLLTLNHTPRYVIYSYGQTLKPADKGILLNGPHMGLCTNYQVTAEVGARWVVRVEGAPQNPHVIVESYNLLPPE